MPKDKRLEETTNRSNHANQRANSVPHMQASNIMFHPNMTHAQMVAWKHEHLDGRKLVMRPEPKEVA